MDFRSHSIVLGEDTIENLYQKKKKKGLSEMLP